MARDEVDIRPTQGEELADPAGIPLRLARDLCKRYLDHMLQRLPGGGGVLVESVLPFAWFVEQRVRPMGIEV
jgi:hypothetical protein